jgi:hypothetical protein
MSADPEPGDRTAFEQSKGPVMDANADRIQGLSSADPLEVEPWVSWVGAELRIGASSPLLHLRRQVVEELPKTARRS